MCIVIRKRNNILYLTFNKPEDVRMPKPSNVLNSSEKLDRPGRRAVRSDNGSVMVDILLTRETNASMYINKRTRYGRLCTIQ